MPGKMQRGGEGLAHTSGVFREPEEDEPVTDLSESVSEEASAASKEHYDEEEEEEEEEEGEERAEKKPASLQEVLEHEKQQERFAKFFSQKERFLFTSWRRTPFDLSAMPLALRVSQWNFLVLDEFDADGNVFKLHPSGDDPRFFVMECVDMQPQQAKQKREAFLTENLSVASSKELAAVWQFSSYPAFRGGPKDMALQIRLRDSGQLLCSNEETREVLLKSDEELAAGPQDALELNVAWEATLDADTPEFPEFDKHLAAVMRESWMAV